MKKTLTESQVRDIIRRELGMSDSGPPISLTGTLSEGISYHVSNGIPLRESIYRFGSSKHLEMIREARELFERGEISVDANDRFILETDLGNYGVYMGRAVPLDLPMEDYELNEAEYRGKKVNLNSPKRGGGKSKFYVYVKNDKGNVIKLGFGQPGVAVKTHSPERVRSFLARHNCDSPGPRWKARWWACNLHRYKKQLGLKFKGRW
jgi:hypothetical protein